MKLTKEQVLVRLRKYIEQRYGTPKKAAGALGVSQAFVSRMLAGKTSIPVWVLAELGVERTRQIVVTYEVVNA